MMLLWNHITLQTQWSLIHPFPPWKKTKKAAKAIIGELLATQMVSIRKMQFQGGKSALSKRRSQLHLLEYTVYGSI